MTEPTPYDEMIHCTLPNKKRRRTAARVLEASIKHQGASLSSACGPGLRQAAGDLFAHADTTVETLLSGHFQQVIQRTCQHSDGGLLLVAQDTTYLDFSSRTATQGLGYFNAKRGRGLICHSALSMTPEGMPLGLLDLNIFVREGASLGKAKDRRRRPIQEKESYRWLECVHNVEQRVKPDQDLLIIADREADITEYLLCPRRQNTHLLVRAFQARNATDIQSQEYGKLFELVSGAPIACQIEVDVCRTPQRIARLAKMNVQYLPVCLGSAGKGAKVYVVRTLECDPPGGEEPLEWVLLCTLPIESAEQAAVIAGYYSKRWMIERLHYVLKSGCGAERLQLDDAWSLSNAVALYYVKAWWLLFLTHLAREKPDTPVEQVLRPAEIAVLNLKAREPIKTVAQAVIAIARLAGYADYPSSAPPGPKLIWMGINRLEAMAAGYELAIQSMEQ